MKTELLISVDKNELLGTNEEAFKHLIMASGQIIFEKKHIEYNSYKYAYELETYNTNNSDVINYHFTFKLNDEKFHIDSPDVYSYSKLQDFIESIVRRNAKHVEVLWDDLSYNCAQKAYPLIYTIENQMRSLITKFMLVNVGTKWEKENMPSQLKRSKSVQKNSNKENSDNQAGIVYSLDFIELADVLFKNYAFKDNIKELENITDITRSDLDPFIPKSNWERYFKEIIEIESDSIQSKWKTLYDYRCTIAHNRRIKYSDYGKIKNIHDEVQPILSRAIEKLSCIQMSDVDKEAIVENMASIKNEKIGTMIVEYRKLKDIVYNMILKKGIDIQRSRPMNRMIIELLNNNLINDDEYKCLKRIAYCRNAIVHGNSPNELNEERLNCIINDIVNMCDNLSNKENDIDDTK